MISSCESLSPFFPSPAARGVTLGRLLRLAARATPARRASITSIPAAASAAPRWKSPSPAAIWRTPRVLFDEPGFEVSLDQAGGRQVHGEDQDRRRTRARRAPLPRGHRLRRLGCAALLRHAVPDGGGGRRRRRPIAAAAAGRAEHHGLRPHAGRRSGPLRGGAEERPAAHRRSHRRAAADADASTIRLVRSPRRTARCSSKWTTPPSAGRTRWPASSRRRTANTSSPSRTAPTPASASAIT